MTKRRASFRDVVVATTGVVVVLGLLGLGIYIGLTLLHLLARWLS